MVSSMKIGFIKATNEIDVQWFKPLAFGYLKSFLDKNLSGSASMTQLNQPDNVDTFDVLAISSTSQDYARAIEIARLAKQENRKIVTVLGGHHITHLPATLAGEFDVAVRGEGEQTFLELITYFQKNGLVVQPKELSKIRGIIFRENANLVATDNRPLIDLDALPHPDRQCGGPPYIFTSRGCPFKCSFCSSSAFWDQTRFFSAEYVVEEIEQVLQQFPDTKQIPIWDDLFIANQHRLLKIIDLLEAKGISTKVKFSFTVRANLIDDEMCQVLKRLDISGVSFGAESGSDRVLKLMNKSVTVRQNQLAIDLLHAHGIPITCSFILGWPTETESEVRRTLDFVLRNMTAGKLLNSNAVNILMPLPGTALWDNVVRDGIVELGHFDWKRLSIFASYKDSNLQSFDEWVNHRRKNNSLYLNEKHLPQERLYEIMAEYYRTVERLQPSEPDKKHALVARGPDAPSLVMVRPSRLPSSECQVKSQGWSLPWISDAAATPLHDALDVHCQSFHDEMVSAVPDGAATVLCVGCGAGAFSRVLKSRDKRRRVVAIEHSEDALPFAPAAGDQVDCVDVEQFDPPFQPGDFDCILMAGLLERLVDPWAAAQRYAAFLKADGTLIAAVPNLRNLGLLRELVELGTWTYGQGGILDRAHLRFFTKKELLRLMEQAGIHGGTVRYLGGEPPRATPSAWGAGVVASGNFELHQATADAFAELRASHLLFEGIYQPQTASRQGASGGADQAYAAAFQLANSGRIEQAINALEGLLALHPNHALSHNDLGVLHYQRKDLGKALFHYEKAVAIDPCNVTFIKNLADFKYVEMGHLEDSQRLYCSLLATHPNDMEAIEILAHICKSLNQMHAAASLYSKILGIAPGHADARNRLEAINRYHATNHEVPEPEQHYREANILVTAGMVPEAIVLLEALCRSHPNHASLHNDLGVLHTQTDNLERALEHHEKAVQLSPANATFLKNLGDFYLAKLERVEDFIKLYLAALQAAPRDVEALVLLGNVYAALKLPTEADSFYGKAIAIEPENEHARQGMERLRNAQQPQSVEN